MEENKVYAVKKPLKGEWWAAIDCGKTKTGGMTYGTFWQSHFRHGENTYRWHNKIFNPPADLREWQEIKVHEEMVLIIANDKHNIFEGFEDQEDLAFTTLAEFSKLLGKPLSITEVKKIIDEFNKTNP
jgi:hypothetical protein